MTKSLAETCVEYGCAYPYDQYQGSHEAGHPSEPIAYTGSDPATRAVYGVLHDLLGRRGIKWALQSVDQDVRSEMVTTLAEVVRHAFVGAPISKDTP